MSDIESEVREEAAETAVDVAAVVAEGVAAQAAEDAVEELAEQVIEHVDEALDDMRDVVETQEEDEQWLRLTNELRESEARILTAMQAMISESRSAEPTLTAEQELTAEALEEAADELQETQAEVLEFDPESVAPEAAPDAEASASRRRVRGLRKRR